MDYAAIKAEIALPAYASMTDTQKAAALMVKTVPGTASKALLEPSQIINAIVFADLVALTALQLQQLNLLLQCANAVDASPGTVVRTGIQALFSGKTTTLNNLAALVAPYDAPTIPFARVAGETINTGDIIRARAS